MKHEYFHNTFARNLAGLNGKGVQLCAKSTVKSVEEEFYNGEIEFEGDGAMKWKLSGNYLPEDCAEAMAFIDLSKATEAQKRLIMNASIPATHERREAQTKAFLQDYIKRNENRVLDSEERFEMECAFGKGATVVNVITGQKFCL